MFLCEHYGELLSNILFYSKKGKPITIEIACIRKMMKLINRKTSDYYRRVSLDTLTPMSELSYEIKEEVAQDYIYHVNVFAELHWKKHDNGNRQNIAYVNQSVGQIEPPSFVCLKYL